MYLLRELLFIVKLSISQANMVDKIIYSYKMRPIEKISGIISALNFLALFFVHEAPISKTIIVWWYFLTAMPFLNYLSEIFPEGRPVKETNVPEIENYVISKSEKFIAVFYTALALMVLIILFPFLPFTALIIAAVFLIIPYIIFSKLLNNFYNTNS